MEYRVIDVDRRPRRCTVCGAEVCDILYRQPGTVDVEEYYKTTGSPMENRARTTPVLGQAINVSFAERNTEK